MKKTAYILRDGGPFCAAIIAAMQLEEFVTDQLRCAGLQVAAYDKDVTPPAEGAVFLRVDADFAPDELRTAICSNENVRLTDPNGDVLALVLDARHAQTPDFAANTALPCISLRHACRITAANCSEILAARQKRLLTRYKDAGVLIENDRVTLSPLYTVGSGTFIAAGTTLSGTGRIGKDCLLRGGRLHNVTLGDGITIEQSVLTDCRVDSFTTVGPFAYLRPGTVIGERARIGDFVEIKNAEIGNGTKVSHLTYVGDCDVGSGVNFGCGTVVSNYDGLHKYRTVIGDNAFIGCNTNLVAPVTVGNNAYIAAGSTVTEPVPDGALAIARQRQTNKENWVQQNKPELIK